MTKVSANALGTQLTTILRSVQEGQTIIVTEGGRGIAEIRPIERPRDDTLSQRLRALSDRGFISGSLSGRPSSRRRRPPLKLPDAHLTDAVLDDREERF